MDEFDKAIEKLIAACQNYSIPATFAKSEMSMPPDLPREGLHNLRRSAS